MKNISRNGTGRFLSFILAALVILGAIPISARAENGAAHFADVPSGHWAYQYVERAYQDGAIVGTGGDPAAGSGTFSPDKVMTYGEFLTMLVNAFYPEELGRAGREGPWYAPAIRVTVNRELTFISEEDLMEKWANKPINRYNAAWILLRILDDKCVVLPTDQEREDAAAKIADWDAVSTGNFAYFVSGVYSMGIISGVDDSGTFDGNGRITRASATVIYTKMADKIQTSGGDPKAFHVTFDGDWSSVPEGFREDLEEEFYLVYPRLWARWGTAKTSKHVTVRPVPQEEIDGSAGRTSYPYDSLRRQSSLLVRLAVEDINERPHNRATFAHELTHAATKSSTIQKTGAEWLRECLADYGSFRYASWANEQYLCAKHYYQPDDETLRTWRYEAYKDSYWFFAWLDEKYPTSKTGYGLIDSLHLGIQRGEITSDGGPDQSDANFNAAVKQVTGFDNIEQLRQQYVKELDAGTWTFDGFAGFPDNYITENLPGVPNPTYPTRAGFNLCSGTYTYSASGETSPALAANNLVDGDRSTRWEAASGDVLDQDSLWSGVQHELCISLGRRPLTFNSYTLYHAGSQGNSGENTKAWRIRYYDPAQEKWLHLDEVQNNTDDVTTRTFAPVSGSALWLEILDPGGTGDGTVRLYEMELFYNE